MLHIRMHLIRANSRVLICDLAMSQAHDFGQVGAYGRLIYLNLFILIFLNLKQYDQWLTIVCYIGLKAMYVMH